MFTYSGQFSDTLGKYFLDRGEDRIDKSTFLRVLLTELSDILNLSVTAYRMDFVHQDLNMIADEFHIPNPKSFAGDLNQFPALACTDILKHFEYVNQNTEYFLQFFDKLSANAAASHSIRQNPIIRMLRRHWNWRWGEFSALLNEFGEKRFYQNGSKFYEHFFSNLWLRKILVLPEINCYIVVGPVFNRALDTREKIEVLSYGIAKFNSHLATVGRDAIYRSSRYFQFLHDRFGIEPEEFERRCKNVDQLIQSILKLKFDGDETFNANDLRHAIHFLAYSIRHSDTKWNESTDVISYSYIRSHCIDERKELGVLRARTETNKAQLVFSGQFKTTSAKPIASVEQQVTTVEPEISKEIKSLCEHSNSLRVNRQLEDLMFLRYELSGSYPISEARSTHSVNNGNANRRRYEEGKQKRELARRILRLAVEGTNAGAAVLYNYDHKSRMLSVEGIYRNNQYKEDSNAAKEYELANDWVETLGQDPTQREQSLSYRAIDNNEAILYNYGEAGICLHSAKKSASGINPPKELNLPIGKSVVSAPIRVFGRRWGVLEIAAEECGVFSVADAEYIEKICHLSGHHYHETTVFESLGELIGAMYDDPVEYFAELPPKLAKLFLCEAVTVWRKDEIFTEQYVCGGSYGRKDIRIDEAGTELQQFTTEVKNSIAVSTIKEGLVWRVGEIGVAPFDAEWLAKEHTASLRVDGFRYIALIPIYRSEKDATGFISLYSKSTPFNDGWQVWARYISIFMNTVLMAIYDKVAHEADLRTETFHTISNSLSNIVTAYEKMEKTVSRMDKSQLDVSELLVRLEDLKAHSHSISFEIEEAKKDGVGKGISKLPEIEIQNMRPVSFWETYKECFINKRNEMEKAKHLTLLHSTIDPTVGVKMRVEDLRNILTNLQSNVLKYSSAYTPVYAEMKNDHYTLKFTLKNVGLKTGLASGDQSRLFGNETRGPSAKLAGIDGSGVGLFTIAQICNKYGLNYEYTTEPVKNKEGLISSTDEVHTLSIDFPKRRIAKLL